MVIWYEFKLSIVGITDFTFDTIKNSFLKSQYIDDQGSYKTSKIKIHTPKFNVMVQLPLWAGFEHNRVTRKFIAGSSLIGVVFDQNDSMPMEEYSKVTQMNFTTATYYHILCVLNFYDCLKYQNIGYPKRLIELIGFLTYKFNMPVYLFNYCTCSKTICVEKNMLEFSKMWRSVYTRYNIEKNSLEYVDKSSDIWVGTHLTRNPDIDFLRKHIPYNQNPSFEMYALMTIFNEFNPDLLDSCQSLSVQLLELIQSAEKELALYRLLDADTGDDLANYYRLLSQIWSVIEISQRI